MQYAQQQKNTGITILYKEYNYCHEYATTKNMLTGRASHCGCARFLEEVRLSVSEACGTQHKSARSAARLTTLR